MKITVATSFLKGSLSAIEAAEFIKETLENSHQIQTVPIADGGDGTLDAVQKFMDCKKMFTEVTGPLGRKIRAKWLLLPNKTAVIEAAQANGLSLLTSDEYNPLAATSYGVGELIKTALNNGCKKIYIGIGGSATNDGGIGLLQALGMSLKDCNGQELGYGGAGLNELCSFDLTGIDKRIKNTEIVVICDVKNPLCGKNGASFVYAPQKGATPEDVALLDSCLAKLADITAKTIGKDYRLEEGTGAAGGIGFSLKAFLSAKLVSGFDFIAEISGLEEKIKTSDLIITTEGRLDSQSLSGKAPWQVAQLANKHNVPCIIFTGSIERGFDIHKAGFKEAYCIANNSMNIEYSINNADKLLAECVKKVINNLF